MIWRAKTLIESYNKRISTRLMGLYVLLLLIPTLALGIYGQMYIQRYYRGYILQDIANQILAKDYSIDASLVQIHDDVLYLEDRIEATTLQPDTLTLNADMNAMANRHSLYRHIAWLRNDGTLLAGSLSTLLSQWVREDSFQTLANLSPNSIRFSTLFNDPNDDNSEALLIATIKLPMGHLLLDLNIPYLMQNLPSTTNEESQGRWAIWVQDNVLLTSSRLDDAPTLVREEFEQEQGSFFFDQTTAFYSQTGPGNNWYLLYFVDNRALQPDLNNYYPIFLVVVFGGLIAVVGLALLAISRIIDPIYQLEDMVDAVRHRNERIPIPANIPDNEFGKLITAFDQMTGELRARQENERALIEQLIHAQEDERKRIAYELHDGLIQDLIGARFYLSEAKDMYPVAYQNHATEEEAPIESSYDILTQAIAEGRQIIQGLHPTVLEDLGLEAALQELAKISANKGGWTIESDIQPLPHTLDKATSVTIYRITQEALNNVCKHAQATHVTLRIRVTKKSMCLCICDDGHGFVIKDVLRYDTHHWGMRTMHERAKMLGGTCEIQSNSGKGTMVTIKIPYNNIEITPN